MQPASHVTTVPPTGQTTNEAVVLIWSLCCRTDLGLTFTPLSSSSDARGTSIQRAGQDHVWLRAQRPFQTKLWRSALQVLPAWETHASECPVQNARVSYSPFFLGYFCLCFNRNIFQTCTTTSWTWAWRLICTPPSGSWLSSQPSFLFTWSSISLTCCCVRLVMKQ